MSDRIASIGLAALIVTLVVLEVLTPCSGFVIDQPGCYLQARDQAEAVFEEIGEELAP